MSEPAEQMHKRLCGVIAAARYDVLRSPYAWQQISALSLLPADALAVVRDDSAWYALTSARADAAAAYRILAFHFAEGSNASGFVAWLAGLIKQEAGTGAMVVCGFDARATPVEKSCRFAGRRRRAKAAHELTAAPKRPRPAVAALRAVVAGGPAIASCSSSRA